MTNMTTKEGNESEFGYRNDSIYIYGNQGSTKQQFDIIRLL